MLPKFSCICLTYDRPELLGRALYAFLRQDYPDDRCELIILDDAGQYQEHADTLGKRWEIVSIDRRFSSLGAKRNAAMALASRDVDAFVIWDDDDYYLPWTLRAHAKALEHGDWSKPSLVLDDTNNGVVLSEPSERDQFHASWSFTRDVFLKVGGYPCQSDAEDKALAAKFVSGRVPVSDPINLGFDPFFVFTRFGSSYHVSYDKYDYDKLITRELFVDLLHPIRSNCDYEAKCKQLLAERAIGSVDRSAVTSRLMEVFDG